MEERPEWVYHATLARNLMGIRGNGLLPNADRTPNFDGYPVDGRLFVTVSEEAAGFYLEALASAFEAPPALVRLPASLVRLERDPYGNPGDRFTRQAVAPEHLFVHRRTEWLPIRSLRLRSPWPTARKDTIQPDFVIGALSVFRSGRAIEVTDDGNPVDGKSYRNSVARFVVDADGTGISDAALPRAAGHAESLATIMARIGLAVSGRAETLLAINGVRYADGHWYHRLDADSGPPTPGI